ncbi:polymeric immunoglobulin receptor-like [Myiozetetes cayanensis]|uniref:polymeric immunoglobulin receptor-like n=1 Tax=Myiozetetes cayanensis TaxID=478635 RepID=UPI0021608F98|nr:polymeric immunoglobulin receptor-like [Myiozetetes cayanensis]
MELRALLLLLLCFPGLQAQAPHAKERQQEGSTLHIQCPYTDKTHKQHWKVWCRLQDEQCYDPVVITNSQRMSQTRDRVTIKDDPAAKTVSVTMTGLKAEDSGTYFCAVSRGSGNYSPLKTISLNVFKEVLLWELDTLWLQCPYNNWGYSTTWCRREGQAECGVMASTDYHSTLSNSRAPHDRTSIMYNNYLGTVTVTVKKLQAQDSGTYWCALSGHTRVMEVMLSVFKRTQQYTAKESGNVSVQCLYKNTDYGAVSKAWCKEGARTPCEVLVTTSSGASGNQRTSQDGRVRIQDDAQRGIVTITMEQLQTQDSGVYWCALHETSGPFWMEEVTLKVSKALAPTALSDTEGASQATPLGDSPAPSSNGSAFIPLSVVLSILLILALITSVTLCVRLHKLLERTGNRGAEDTYGNSEGTAQLGSTERSESSKNDSKGLKHMNLDLQSRPSPEDPLYCNIEASQAPRNPHGANVEYAVIAFNQFPRNDAG